MSKSKPMNPTQFFFHQNQDMKEEQTAQAKDFAAKLLNHSKCPICKKDYDLNEHTPKILVQCGHTFCIQCLQMFFKDFKIRCPMCLKLIKRIRGPEVLPTNHTIHSKLIKTLPQDSINPFFERLMLPSELNVENPEDLEPEPLYGCCEVHPDRVKHFICYTCKAFICRPCWDTEHTKLTCKVTDLYELGNEEVRVLLHGIMNEDGEEEDEDDIGLIGQTLNTSF